MVEVGGKVSDHKGVNVPDVLVPIPALTEKDKSDLAFALEQGADWIALSFVQRPEDVAEARALIGDRAALLAKIEKPAAIDRLDAIIAAGRRGDGRARRPRRRASARRRAAAAEPDRRRRPPIGQAGGGRDADARIDDHLADPDAGRGQRRRHRDLRRRRRDHAVGGKRGRRLSVRSGGDDGPHRHQRRARPDLSRRGSISPKRRPSRPPPMPCPRSASISPSIVSARGDGLLHQLRFDRAADRPRAAAGADPGDDRIADGRAAARPAMGRARGRTPATSAISRKWSARPSAWRCAISIAGAGDRLVIMAGVPFGVSGSTNVIHVVRLNGDELDSYTGPAEA